MIFRTYDLIVMIAEQWDCGILPILESKELNERTIHLGRERSKSTEK